MNASPSRVTIRDVAADTGLSISTVSRALSGARAVTPDIGERVRESADRLGYRVDSIGRALRTQRTKTLGLVIPDITNPFFPALVQALEHSARALGLGILIADADNDPGMEREALRTLVDRRVDAVLISPTDTTASLPGIAETAQRVRLIQIDRVIDESLPFVRIDQAAPVEALVAHLRATGRRHIAFIGQQPTIATSGERERTFVRAMGEHFPGEAVRVLSGMLSAESGRSAARDIVSAWPETDAIICANDTIAVGVLEQLGPETGRRTIAVSGFDDTLVAQALQLTSVRQPVDELATVAVSFANGAAIEEFAGSVSLVSEVIFRASTA